MTMAMSSVRNSIRNIFKGFFMEIGGKQANGSPDDERQVKDIALGSEHTICLATDETLWAWGWNEHANTGTGPGEIISTPTRVPLDNNEDMAITQIYAGGASNFVVVEKKVQTPKGVSISSEQ